MEEALLHGDSGVALQQIAQALLEHGDRIRHSQLRSEMLDQIARLRPPWEVIEVARPGLDLLILWQGPGVGIISIDPPEGAAKEAEQMCRRLGLRWSCVSSTAMLRPILETWGLVRGSRAVTPDADWMPSARPAWPGWADVLLKRIRAGMSLRTAAELAGLNESTVYRLRSRDLPFRRALEAARQARRSDT